MVTSLRFHGYYKFGSNKGEWFITYVDISFNDILG